MALTLAIAIGISGCGSGTPQSSKSVIAGRTVDIHGGLVTSHDGKASVTFPQNALSQETNVNVRTINDLTNQPQAVSGTALEVSPSVNLQRSVELTFHISPVSLPHGVDFQRLSVYQVNDTGSLQRILSTSDPASGQVRGYATHLGRFVVLADSRFMGSYVGASTASDGDVSRWEATVSADGTARFHMGDQEIQASVSPTGAFGTSATSRQEENNAQITGQINLNAGRLELTGKWERGIYNGRLVGRQAAVTAEIKGYPQDKKYFITTEPRMPEISLSAEVSNPDGVSGCNRYVWKALLSYNAKKYGAKISNNFSYNKPIVDPAGQSGNRWQPQFYGPSIEGGGDLTIQVWVLRQGESDNTAPNRAPDAEVKDLRILGKNPMRSEITEEAHNIVYAKILSHESGIQFGTGSQGFEGMPRWEVNPPAGNVAEGKQGVGLSQITPPQNHEQLWNWRINVTIGQSVLKSKAGKARGYPEQVRSAINKKGTRWNSMLNRLNQQRASQKLPAIERVNVPDFIEGDWQALPLGQVEMDAIRGFNGYAGSDPGGYLLHEFTLAHTGDHDPENKYPTFTPLLTNIRQENGVWVGDASWVRVAPEERDPNTTGVANYVDLVLSAQI